MIDYIIKYCRLQALMNLMFTSKRFMWWSYMATYHRLMYVRWVHPGGAEEPGGAPKEPGGAVQPLLIENDLAGLCFS